MKLNHNIIIMYSKIIYLDLSNRDINFYNYHHYINTNYKNKDLIEHLDLYHNNIDNSCITPLLKIFSHFSNLNSINLGWNSIKHQSIIELTNWIKTTNIKELILENNKLEWNDIELIANCLYHLDSINIKSCLINDNSLDILTNCININQYTIKELFIGNNLFKDSINNFLYSISHLDNLSKLSISNSNLQLYIPSLCHLIETNNTITDLDISNNNFSVENILTISNSLKKNNNITNLIIDNSIPNSILPLLDTNITVLELNKTYSHFITNPEFIVFSNKLNKINKIEILSISNTNIINDYSNIFHLIINNKSIHYLHISNLSYPITSIIQNVLYLNRLLNFSPHINFTNFSLELKKLIYSSIIVLQKYLSYDIIIDSISSIKNLYITQQKYQMCKE